MLEGVVIHNTLVNGGFLCYTELKKFFFSENEEKKEEMAMVLSKIQESDQGHLGPLDKT